MVLQRDPHTSSTVATRQGGAPAPKSATAARLRAGQAPGQAEPLVDRPQQNGAPVGTGLGLVEPGDDRLPNPVEPDGAVRDTSWWPSSLRV
jgi:hypothetical protein